jgi:acetate kinase
MRVLVLNCGSSSVKSALVDSATGRRLFEARVEELGRSSCRLRVADAVTELGAGTTLEPAVRRVLAEADAVAPSTGAAEALAHRVVHGGERLVWPTPIDGPALAVLDEVSVLAPLHNPPAIAAIRIAREVLPGLPHVAVFDTAFHVGLPARSREYALPRELARRRGIRRYGFHGTSHAHVSEAAAAFLGSEPQALRIVSCHLGNGSSVTAIEYGRSVDTSMGMTPMEGLVMGTRPGDLDPGVILHLLRSGECDVAGLDELLNQRSGLFGLTGTQDMREIERRAAEGEDACRLAITLYAHRVRKYIGAYAAVMGGVDVIAFTGGIGENSPLIRHRCAQRLEFLGALLDEDRNREPGACGGAPVADISAARSRARLLVVRADEEAAIAREAARRLAAREDVGPLRIPVAVSARHAHLSQATIERLFGPGYALRAWRPLSQAGQFAARETVALIGPSGRIDGVRLMGPPRDRDQVEISRTDEFSLGVDAPVRLSGDLYDSPGITLEGPAGRATLSSGLISARRHVHMSPRDAERFGVRDREIVRIQIDSEDRDLSFGDVVVRVSPGASLELHLDTDEANAAGIERGDRGELVEHGEVRGRVERGR